MMKILTLLFFVLSTTMVFGQAKALNKVAKVKKEDLGLIDPDTGKPLPDSAYKITSVKEIGRRFIPDYDERAAASFDELNVCDANGKKVKLDLNRVTLVEYWTKRANKHNKFWQKARELEKQYAEETGFQLISINHETEFNTPDKITGVLNYLKEQNLEKPKNLYFDLNDSFRDEFYVFGPVIYLLIDNRRQLTNAGRGEFDRTQEEVFDQIENALKNFHKDGLITNAKANNTK